MHPSARRSQFRFSGTRWVATGIGAAFVVSLIAHPVAPAHAAGFELRTAGPFIGISTTPDQFIFGGKADFGELSQNFHIDGAVDVGFGDDFTVLTLGPSLLYDIPMDIAGTLFFGGGVALVYASYDYEATGPMGRTIEISGSDTDLGAFGEVGYAYPMEENALFIDVKIGIMNEYPDAKFLFGYEFGVD